MSTAYYNEIDPYAAQWLINLIDAGHIAHGVVDTRSIEDVTPRDLEGFTQCHFFAGIGVWSYALRRAGWADDRPVWTGSCPCQPFSAAGKGAGFADERHLWPAWRHLIGECEPAAIFGEQVASSDAAPWLDLVQDDLEAMGYAFGAVPFPAASVGAPHIRDRLYFVAHAERKRVRSAGCGEDGSTQSRVQSAHGQRERLRPDAGTSSGVLGLLGNAGNERLAQRVGESRVPGEPAGSDQGQATERAGVHAGVLVNPASEQVGIPGRTRQPGGAPGGFWADCDWIACRDGKARPVEPGTFPLAHGAPARVGRLRAYGNAINAEAARVFIESVMEANHA